MVRGTGGSTRARASSGPLRAGGGPAEIGPAPDIGTFVGGILATILAPIGLGAIGLVVLVVTSVKFANSTPRRP